MKRIIIIIIIILVGWGAYTVIGRNAGPTISDLELHFEESGFRVWTTYQSAEEKQFIENFKQNAERLQTLTGGSKDSPIVESGLKTINNIDVEIDRYKSKAAASAEYTKRVKGAANDKHRSDYHLNGKLILEINHYKVHLVNGRMDLNPTTLELDESELAKIVSAFKSF